MLVNNYFLLIDKSNLDSQYFTVDGYQNSELKL